MEKHSCSYIRAQLRERQADRSHEDAIHATVQRIQDGDPNVFTEILAAGVEEAQIPRQLHMFIANMMLNAGDEISRRIAVRPVIEDQPSNTVSNLARNRARLGSFVKQHWWDANHMNVAGYQIARWLLSYSEIPILVRPDMDKKIPCYEEMHPLSAWSSDGTTWRPTPSDVIFEYRQPVRTLMARYPDAKWPPQWVNEPTERTLTVVRKLDKEYDVSYAYGPVSYGQEAEIELDKIPNRTGIPLFVMPRLISTGSRQGAFNQMIGLMAAKARLQYLSIIAAERGVFPDTFVAGTILSDTINEGPDGVTEIERDGKVYRLGYQSSFQFLQEIDRLTGEMRQASSYPAQLDGLTPSTLATGRGNSMLLSATVDAGIKERQEILGVAYAELIERGVLVAKKFFGDAPIPIVVRQNGVRDVVTYRPSQLIEGVTNVEYGMLSSADVQSATVILGEMKGIGMSRNDVFNMHPLIADAEGAEIRSDIERMDESLKQAIDQDIANSILDPRAVIRMQKARAAGRTLGEAYEDALEALEKEAGEGALPPVTPPTAPAPNIAPPSPEQILQTTFLGRG